MNAYWKLGIIAAWTLFVAFSSWHIHTWKDGAELADANQALLDERIAKEQALATLATLANKKLSDDRAEAEDTQKKVDDDVKKNPSGYACKLPDNGLLLYRKAIASTSIAR